MGLPLCAVSVGTLWDELCSLVKVDLQGYGIKRLASNGNFGFKFSLKSILYKQHFDCRMYF